MRVAMSASLKRMAWNLERLRPKASRSVAYWRAASKAASAIAADFTPCETRPVMSASIRAPKAPSLPPSSASSGTSQSSKTSSAVSEERWPIFSSLRVTSKPGVSRSTMKTLMPSPRLERSV